VVGAAEGAETACGMARGAGARQKASGPRVTRPKAPSPRQVQQRAPEPRVVQEEAQAPRVAQLKATGLVVYQKEKEKTETSGWTTGSENMDSRSG
jgi:hypothetical protein